MQASSLKGAALAARPVAGAATQPRGASTVTCVATPSRPPASNKAKRSKVELIKEKSDFLRHPLMQVRRQGRRCQSLLLPEPAAAACCRSQPSTSGASLPALGAAAACPTSRVS